MTLRHTWTAQSLGAPALSKVRGSRILMVGAGGIGCELLKNLALSGFETVEIVDLDTIDLSNLNRQFLFQQKHIGKAKAHVARESALRFNPDSNIVSHHKNIMDPAFDVEWFGRFDVVLNALDNVAARRYVNMMCLAAKVPLVESGTAGYLGQVSVHKGGIWECFDCEPKPVPKTFPVCTIRSTPSLPIHCIVWAKTYLFGQLFGAEAEQDINEDESAENASEIANLKKETEALKNIRNNAGKPEFAKLVFEKVYTQDVERLISMSGLWETRKPPTPLKFRDLASSTPAQPSSTLDRDQQKWSLQECFNVFKTSLVSLSQRLIANQKSDPKAALSFDKDDDEALDFVTAAANLRAHIFRIDIQTRFKVKEMAGNIIPAIATTNAIIAGIIVLETFKILTGRLEDCQTTYLLRNSRLQAQLLTAEAGRPPNPRCYVCTPTYLSLRVKDLAAFTVQDLLTHVLGGALGLVGADADREVAISEGARLLYDLDFEDNCARSLADLDVRNGAMVNVGVEDEGEGVRWNLMLSILARPALDKPFELDAPKAIPSQPIRAAPVPAEAAVPAAAAAAPTAGTKRKAEPAGDAAALKKAKMAPGDAPADGSAPAPILVVDDDGIVLVD